MIAVKLKAIQTGLDSLLWMKYTLLVEVMNHLHTYLISHNTRQNNWRTEGRIVLTDNLPDFSSCFQVMKVNDENVGYSPEYLKLQRAVSLFGTEAGQEEGAAFPDNGGSLEFRIKSIVLSLIVYAVNSFSYLNDGGKSWPHVCKLVENPSIHVNLRMIIKQPFFKVK